MTWVMAQPSYPQDLPVFIKADLARLHLGVGFTDGL